MIEIKSLTHIYEKGEERINALKDVNLEVKDGEFLAILGGNGSGKSTLLKQLNGILTPTSGEVLVDSLNTQDPSSLSLIRQKVGMVFQNPDNQIVATKVEEDVAFGPENLGLPSAEIRKRVDEALDVVGMSEFCDSEPHLLSGGEKQKVAIAGALAMNPKYLVLDEVTSQLDPHGSKQILRTISRLNRDQKVTVVYVTHFIREILDADRIVILKQGTVAKVGTPAQVLGNVEELKSLEIEPLLITTLASELKALGIDILPDILTIDGMVERLCLSN